MPAVRALDLNVGHVVGRVGLNARWRHIGSMADRLCDDRGSALARLRIPVVGCFDLTAGYDFDRGSADGLIAGAGVVNPLDEPLPLLPSTVQANTDASTYDVLGRRHFVNVT